MYDYIYYAQTSIEIICFLNVNNLSFMQTMQMLCTAFIEITKPYRVRRTELFIKPRSFHWEYYNIYYLVYNNFIFCIIFVFFFLTTNKITYTYSWSLISCGNRVIDYDLVLRVDAHIYSIDLLFLSQEWKVLLNMQKDYYIS